MIGGAILAVGDSLTFGSRDERGSNWPLLLQQSLSARFGQRWVVQNAGIPGQTARELAERFPRELMIAQEAHEVIGLIGTNDAKDAIATPPDVYAQYVQGMWTWAWLKQRKLYWCLIPIPVGFGAPDYSVRIPERIAAFNASLFSLQHQMPHVTLVDLQRVPEQCFVDGIHLSSAGNEWLTSQIESAVVSERLLTRSTDNNGGL